MPPTLRVFALFSATLLPLACGGSSPPPAAPSTSATASPEASSAPSGAPSSAPASPPANDAAPSATVTGIAVSSKGDHFTRVTVSFKNPSKVRCKIPSYTIKWVAGSKTIPLTDFALGPGESQTRAVRVHNGEGDITQLTTPSETQIELTSECGK